jgi:hypothetical protein
VWTLYKEGEEWGKSRFVWKRPAFRWTCWFENGYWILSGLSQRQVDYGLEFRERNWLTRQTWHHQFRRLSDPWASLNHWETRECSTRSHPEWVWPEQPGLLTECNWPQDDIDPQWHLDNFL